ncbi:hypothetical protein [Pseudothauera rhizosphaerae]|uniref:Uncharacterized protein n=1 Tax=Pseudothauera rhizosphaerae TaxID=2565932 RepID=A0A4S4AGN0_9RHOO|nr:hypothetical protein [Pseudothauera rhizosphaerae]THF58047.1 hypothetical protein E6O51_17040 [Pseudothauera rhizosphaerae]
MPGLAGRRGRGLELKPRADSTCTRTAGHAQFIGLRVQCAEGRHNPNTRNIMTTITPIAAAQIALQERQE